MKDERALYIRLKRDAEIWDRAREMAAPENELPAHSPLLRYVADNPGASLRMLYPDFAETVLSGAKWKFAIPAPNEAGRLSMLYHITVDSAAERERLETILKTDPAVLSFRQPVLQYPMTAVQLEGQTPAPDPQWGLAVCKFRETWEILDTGGDLGPIAVIDQGGDLGNADLDKRVTIRGLGRLKTPAVSWHASEVCSIIAAQRDGKGMDGCCSAAIDLYNVCREDGSPDSGAYAQALADVITSKARVLNICLQSAQADEDIAAQIRACIANGIVVVVAMGNAGGVNGPVLFPATLDGVIAVGATTPEDQRPPWGSKGPQMFISAPGQYIQAVSGASGLGTPSGTSYAAAFVSAAVWLMLRARPKLSVDQVKEVLRKSVDATYTKGERTPALGYGRLDMIRMCLNLVNVPTC